MDQLTTDHPVDVIATREPSMLHRDEVVRTAAAVMRDRCVGDVLVVDDGGVLCGILTDRDVALRVVAGGLDPAVTTLGEVLTPSPHVVPTGTGIGAVADVMREHAVRRIPVVDPSGRPVGVVALSDVVRRTGDAGLLAGIVDAAPDF